MHLESVVLYIGYAVFIRTLLASVKWIFLHFIAGNDLSKYGGQGKGAWALVTGGSDGIGLGLAKECAARGMNVLITARNEDTLKAAVEIVRAVNERVQVEYVVADSGAVLDAVDRIKKFCANKLITILVNNVGVESGDPEPFDEKTTSNLDKIIDVNIRFSSHLTKEFIPILQSNIETKKFKGAIINLSSVAAVLQVPLLSSYSGSKAYNQVFSNALAKEMRVRSRGRIDVMCIRPTLVESRMSGLVANSRKGFLLGVVTAESFAKCSLNKLGHSDDVAPHWWHDIQSTFISTMQEYISKGVLYPVLERRMNEQRKQRAKME